MKLKTAVVRLEVGHIPALERPKFTDNIRFPDDLTQLSAQNLSELMGKYGALLGFVEQETTTYAIAEKRIEHQIEEAEVQYHADNSRTRFLEKWKVDLLVRSDQAVRLLHKRLVTVRALKERGLSLVRTYTQFINILSRELSRKISSNDGGRYNRG